MGPPRRHLLLVAVGATLLGLGAGPAPAAPSADGDDEALLEVGDPDNAQRHLAALQSICLLPCEESIDLAAAIAAYQARSRAPR